MESPGSWRRNEKLMLINSVNARTFGFTLSEPPGWLDAPSLQTPSVQVIQRGPIALPQTVQARRVTLRGWVRGSSASDARSKLDSLKLALSFPPVKIVFDDTSTRYHSLHLEGFSTPPLQQGAFLAKDLRVEAQLTAYLPYAFDNSETTVAGTSALPMGTGPVRPVVTLSGATSPVTHNLRDKDNNVVTSMVIAAAGTIIVDHDAKTITDDGVLNLNALTSGDFFVIDPADPKFQGAGPSITSSGASSHSTTFRKTWR